MDSHVEAAVTRQLIGPAHAHLDAPCTDACYMPIDRPQMSIEDRIAFLEQYAEAADRKLDSIIEILSQSKTVIDTVAENVMPTINELKESPMLKMLLPKKK